LVALPKSTEPRRFGEKNSKGFSLPPSAFQASTSLVRGRHNNPPPPVTSCGTRNSCRSFHRGLCPLLASMLSSAKRTSSCHPRRGNRLAVDYQIGLQKTHMQLTAAPSPASCFRHRRRSQAMPRVRIPKRRKARPQMGTSFSLARTNCTTKYNQVILISFPPQLLHCISNNKDKRREPASECRLSPLYHSF